MKSFDALSLAEPLSRALGELGYEKPTEIQARAIPVIASGRDLLGCAQTGTGKTAAFALPVLHRLVTGERPAGGRRPRVLVLSPTRELATQIGSSFAEYGRHTGLRGTVIYGGVSQRRQEMSLRRGVDIVVATPGRLQDLTRQGLMDFGGVEVFVLDEADRMLDMGFIAPIREIAAELPRERQTLMFSATMPREIERLAQSLLREPERVSVAASLAATPKIEQRLYHISQSDKPVLLESLIAAEGVSRAVVFTKTKHGADRVCRKLEQAGVSAVAIHGNKNQNQRQRSLDGFRSGRQTVLVATDVAARGLDVDGVTHVFNYDLPMEPEAYVHRIGRTGRAGATGVAIAFCDHGERRLLRAIEKTTGERIPVMDASNGAGGSGGAGAGAVAGARASAGGRADGRPGGRGGASRGGGYGGGGHAGGHGGGGEGRSAVDRAVDRASAWSEGEVRVGGEGGERPQRRGYPRDPERRPGQRKAKGRGGAGGGPRGGMKGGGKKKSGARVGGGARGKRG